MDTNQNNDCSSYIYSEDYYNFLVRYNNDIQSVRDIYSPECINIINSQFLVAYKDKGQVDSDNLYSYGYNSVPKCYGLMDVTGVVDTGADRVRNLPGLGLTGKDTLVGFIDTGIDYTNFLFRNSDGSSRIRYIWDQSKEVVGTGTPQFGYGAEFSKEDIDRALTLDNPFSLVPSRDVVGHGTFLASVACGGIYEEEPFYGMAPECEILMVKLKQAKSNLRDFYMINPDAICYSEEDIILGIKYLINKAMELGKPIVICLGVGTNQGDHNGTTNLELYMDIISNLRGVCIVSSAGNELGRNSHFAGNGINAQTMSQDMIEINVGEGDMGFVMEIWGNAPGLLSINIISPTGEKFQGIDFTKDEFRKASFLYEGTDIYINNIVVEGNSGDQLIILRFVSPASGIWTINVRESLNYQGRGFDAWLPVYEFQNSPLEFIRSDPNVTICSPGNGRGSITVAGYNHYSNALYINSGRGFTRKGRIKPDLTAPAVNVQGAFVPTGGTTESPLFTTRSGTSVGGAFVAGAVSLILEWALIENNYPRIGTETIRQILIRGTKEIVDIEYPNPAWGWGVLDIFESFNIMRNI